MAFSEIKSLQQLQKMIPIQFVSSHLFSPAAVEIPPALADYVIENSQNPASFLSEVSRCEALIFPVLLIVKKLSGLQLWSHPYVEASPLGGIPDYLFGPQGPLLPEGPFVAVVEAKKNDFEAGWGQCAAALWTVSEEGNFPILGIVTDGRIWELGLLRNKTLYKEQRSWPSPECLESLVSVILQGLQLCQQENPSPQYDIH